MKMKNHSSFRKEATVVFWHIIEKRRILEDGRWQTTITQLQSVDRFQKAYIEQEKIS